MNQGIEAIAVGVLVAAATFAAGVGAASPGHAAGSPAPSAGLLSPSSTTGDVIRTGQFRPGERIEVCPPVSGRIASINFVLEQEVRRGDLLLVIDPAPYQAAFDQARADLSKAQWHYVFAVRERTQVARRQASHRATREDMDASIAAVERAEAALQADKAAMEAAQGNLDKTKVVAPISGIIGRPEVSVGSLVEAGKTPLFSVAPTDEIKSVSN